VNSLRIRKNTFGMKIRLENGSWWVRRNEIPVLGMVADVHNPSSAGAIGRQILVQGWPQGKT
jgi:hypothetical protein